MPKIEHNWNPCPTMNFSCLACGCLLFDIMNEATEAAQKDCPGRTSEFQTQRDEAFAKDTRADLLKHAISDALSLAAKVVRGVRQALHTGQREEVANAAVKTIRELPGDTPDGWQNPNPRVGGNDNATKS